MPETARVEAVQVDRQAFIRLDSNRYSVPTTYAERVVTLVADDRTVRLVDGNTLIVEHVRSWGRRQVLELPAHRTALVAERQAARGLKGRDRLRAVVPTFDRIVERWALSGPSLGFRVSKAIKLLDLYGDHVFAAAAEDLVARGLADVGALAVACEKHRKERGRPVPVAGPFPDHLDDADVVPHALESYDE